MYQHSLRRQHSSEQMVNQIKELGAKAGIVLNPHTSIDVLSEILPDLDFVLLMSVNPSEVKSLSKAHWEKLKTKTAARQFEFKLSY